MKRRRKQEGRRGGVPSVSFNELVLPLERDRDLSLLKTIDADTFPEDARDVTVVDLPKEGGKDRGEA